MKKPKMISNFVGKNWPRFYTFAVWSMKVVNADFGDPNIPTLEPRLVMENVYWDHVRSSGGTRK
jgi:hypothetical protein